jgi:hypothetical protein
VGRYITVSSPFSYNYNTLRSQLVQPVFRLNHEMHHQCSNQAGVFHVALAEEAEHEPVSLPDDSFGFLGGG